MATLKRTTKGTKMYTHKISYEKVMLSGIFKGCNLPCSFNTTEDALAIHVDGLKAVTKDKPKFDMNGKKFYVANVKVEVIK